MGAMPAAYPRGICLQSGEAWALSAGLGLLCPILDPLQSATAVLTGFDQVHDKASHLLVGIPWRRGRLGFAGQAFRRRGYPLNARLAAAGQEQRR